jgi:hypothetical protein
VGCGLNVDGVYATHAGPSLSVQPSAGSGMDGWCGNEGLCMDYARRPLSTSQWAEEGDVRGEDGKKPWRTYHGITGVAAATGARIRDGEGLANGEHEFGRGF